MSLLGLVLTLVVVGVLLWLVNAHIPMDGTIKRIVNIVVIVVVIFWVLSATGVLHFANNVRVPTVK